MSQTEGDQDKVQKYEQPQSGDVSKLQNEVDSLRQKLHAAIKKGKNIQKERDVKAQDCNNLQSQLDSQLAEHEQEIKSLQKQIDAFVQENKLAKQVEQALQKELIETRQLYSSKEEDFQTLKEAIKTAAARLQTTEDEKSTLKKQFDKINEDNSEMRLRVADLEGRLAVQNSAEAHTEKLSSQLYQLEQEKEEMINRMERQEMEIKARDDKIKQLQQKEVQEVSIGREEIEKAEEMKKQAEELIRQAEFRQKETEEKLASSQKQIQKAQNSELEALNLVAEYKKQVVHAERQTEELRQLEDLRKQRFAVLQNNYGDKEITLQQTVESLEEQLSQLNAERQRFVQTMEEQKRDNSELNESVQITAVLKDRLTELQQQVTSLEKSSDEDKIQISQLNQQTDFFRQQLEASHDEQVASKVRHTKEIEHLKSELSEWKEKAEQFELSLQEETLTQENKVKESQRQLVRVQELERQNRELQLKLNNSSFQQQQKQIVNNSNNLSKLEEGVNQRAPPAVAGAPPLVGVIGNVLVYRNYLIAAYVLFLPCLVYFVLTHKPVKQFSDGLTNGETMSIPANQTQYNTKFF